MFRYYITQESLDVGTYPLMDGKTITELAAPVKVEQDSITAFGCIDYPQPLTAEQEREYALCPPAKTRGRWIPSAMPQKPPRCLTRRSRRWMNTRCRTLCCGRTI